MTEKELRSMMPNKLKAYLGCKEGSSQHMDIVNTYNAIRPLPQNYKLRTTDSWCAATVSAMAAKCGFLDIVPAECSCPRQIGLWQKMGRWVENDAYKPKVGDIIYYDWDDSGSGDNKGTADHVGIVCSVDGNSFRVIEGNKSDTVAYRDMKVNGKGIRGFGIPDYAKKATKVEEDDDMPRYQTIKDVPETYRAQVQDYIDRGIIKGKGNGILDLSEDLIRATIYNERMIKEMTKKK